MITAGERRILRKLAGESAEIGGSALMDRRRKRWRRLNDLEAAGDEPLLLIYPEGSWREIDRHLPLECTGEIARSFELSLRRNLYHHHNFGDDFVINGWFETPYFVSDTGWGVEVVKRHSEVETGSWKAVPPLKNLAEDLKKLHFRELSCDRTLTSQWFETAQETFGDLLPVRRRSDFFWSAGLTREVIDLVGLEEFMLLMFDDPANLHRLMRFLTEDQRNYMRQLEKLGIVATNNAASHIGSGGPGFASALSEFDGSGSHTFRERWGLLESQETVGVSPGMFGEFIWPYQKELAAEFGLLYYGCCEAVEGRFEYIRQAENLRAISVSPWSDVRKCTGLYGTDYVLYRKPNPGHICVEFCEDSIRATIRETLEAAAGCNLAIIAKDLHTVSGDLSRYGRWSRIVREEIAAVSR